MKVFSRNVFDWHTCTLESCVAQDYSGRVLEFKSGGKPPASPDYIGAAKEQGTQNLQAIRAGAALNRVNQANPYGSTTYKNLGGDQWEQTTDLSPDQQKILDQQEGNQIDLGRIAGGRLNQVENQGALDLSGLPARATAVAPSQFRSDINAPSVGQSSVNLSDLGNLPTDYSAERQKAEDALYRRQTAQLDPQFQQREEAQRTRLMNSGNAEGSEAWNNEMGNLERERQAAYGDARDRSISAGGAESSRMLADALAGRQETVNERFGTGDFANKAAGQQFANEAARTGFYNTTQGDEFQQNLTNAGLANEGRDAGLSELLTQRGIPLDEFMKLYSGAATGGLQSPGVPQAGTPQAGDFQTAAQQGYNSQSDLYNWNAQRNAQNTNSAINLASIAAQYYSDRRLKRDIEPTGETHAGLPMYRYRYLWSDQEYIGLMADDVQRIAPHAVFEVNGYKAVNYGAL